MVEEYGGGDSGNGDTVVDLVAVLVMTLYW